MIIKPFRRIQSKSSEQKAFREHIVGHHIVLLPIQPNLTVFNHLSGSGVSPYTELASAKPDQEANKGRKAMLTLNGTDEALNARHFKCLADFL